MKKAFFLLIALICYSVVSFGQIGQLSIDSMKVYSQDSNIVDSIYIEGTGNGQSLDSITFQPLNDMCGTVMMNLIFNGCSPVHITFFDTTVVMGFHTKRINVQTLWDTTSSCPEPQSPVVTDTMIWENCTTLNTTGFVDRDEFKVFPNPANDRLQIQISKDVQIEKMELYNQKGQDVRVFGKEDRVLNIGDLPTGIYFLKFNTENENFTKKVAIE